MDAASTTSSAASSAEGRGSGGSDFINRGMFAAAGSQPQQSGSGENMLVGGAGGGFSLGNGFGNDSTGLGGGAVSSSGTSFDLSDFPSLGGTGGGGGGAAPGPGNGLAAALREQQQLLAHQQQMLQSGGGGGGSVGSSQKASSNLQYMLAMTGTNGGNFNIASEDFPALGGGVQSQTSGGGGGNGSLNVSSLLSSSSSIQQSSSNENGGLYGGSGLDNVSSQQLEGGAGLLGGAGLAGLGGLRNPGSSLTPAASGSAPAGAIGSSVSGGASSGSTAGNALTGDYGLLGLLGVIRMTESDRNSLALGSDLQLLGLNMGSAEQIYSTFSSPWSDGGATREPHYQVRRELHVLFWFWMRIAHRPLFCLRFPLFENVSKAANVLLHATSSAENWAFVQIPARDPVLHLLRTAKGCSASVRSARAVLQGMEIPRGTETVVQESWTLGRSSKLVHRVATVLVL